MVISGGSSRCRFFGIDHIFDVLMKGVAEKVAGLWKALHGPFEFADDFFTATGPVSVVRISIEEPVGQEAYGIPASWMVSMIDSSSGSSRLPGS